MFFFEGGGYGSTTVTIKQYNHGERWYNIWLNHTPQKTVAEPWIFGMVQPYGIPSLTMVNHTVLPLLTKWLNHTQNMVQPWYFW